MPIRVAHVGTGNVGGLALAELIANPAFELTGVCVSTPEKVGKDAAELCGVGLDDTGHAGVPTGVKAVDDLDVLLATRPECIVYCAMGDTRLPDAMADVMRILAAGVNVVGSSPGLLQYPWGVMPDKYIARVEDAARQGKSSLFITGVDPGFANDLIPFALAGTCQRIESVRCMEIHDYASYDGAEVMHYMGFARPLDEVPMLLQPGVLSIAWGTAIRQLAAGLGIEVDEITESYQREPAPEDFDIAVGHVAKGTLAALQFEIRGMVKGRPVIVIEHITRLRPDLRPDWQQPAAGGGSYRVEITGEPSYAVDIVPKSRKGDHNHAAIAGAAGRIVNSIPAVLAAPPGIRTTLDLPLVTGKGLYSPNDLVAT
ncbi:MULTISPECIES: NAD(P)H-dependent amine dehydrogenase family protein [Mycobacterium]|uniref:Diacylglycerol kinase n=1 Tax=Mycobacterium kiyosense TaxID=2871094 RepID=A0A9P3UXV9_9MYCO|nr:MULTISPECIES: diacylglycerol kinase [Mycobacterium]BDE11793.1 diacylglycerol kinase [Mycobacterium sp. 20KCMC460]GLB84353.1 diacylglycerol kinase [Mycobacterium kiyosense]GLB90034.1 diacylglycerol kinase [Mycobacterium kiyosense]GLB95537.1 diacylglycerol kinase [Mycobacterium kiyosense]GLC02485.1 diacylglycerol kinase [Mycobacterium kiyosense]